MAIGGTPVGNMIIKVDLDSSGVEKSMTGLQRQLKSSNKAMGAQLSAFDRGEKSAAKYGVLIEGLTNRHRIQARMVEEARKKYQYMSKTYGENSVKAQQASQELNEQIARYQETGRELDNVTAEFKEFQRVQEIQNKGWYKAADSMEQWGGKLQAAGTQMDQTGKTLTRSVSLPLGAVGYAAVKTGSDFEAGMSKVEAISGASADDMKRLEEQAREMGATTVFSASEAASGMEFLAMAGFETNEIMAAMPGLLDLAASSNMDLGRAADITSNIISAFGYEASEAGRVSDVLAKGASTANTDVEGLGNSMATVAPVAASLGIDLESAAAATGKMADAGIDGSQAGRMLRQGMLRLSKPTGEAADLIEELGINVFDADGNMKSLDGVVAELEKGLDGMTGQSRAAALATIFGSESTAGWSALLEVGSDTLADYTTELKNSEGAAADMADTMQDNLQGSLKELKSMVEDLFIELYQNLKPSLESIIESAKDLTQWFSELSPKTQENITKFGMLAFAMGPVLSATGKLTYGIGGLMKGTGALAKTIGLSKGAGLLGALAGLGPGAIAGIAVAGLTAVGIAVYNLKEDSEELEEVNLDVATSLSDQAIELDKNANTFDKLSEKAKISNEQLAELNDLNIRISQSSNPGEINELQKQYDALAKKSGLSKEELQQLFEANAHIIEQSPDVETSISNQGNEFVESTEAVNEYIQSLLELSRQELSDEMVIAEENKREILKDNKQLKEDIAELDQASVDLRKLDADTESERQQNTLDWMVDVKEQMALHKGDQEKMNELRKEEEIIVAFVQDGLAAGLEVIKEQRDELNEKVAKNDEELEKINTLNEQMSDIVLKQVGINEEGEKGLAALDESIAKNDEELAKLEEKLQKNGELTEEERERYTKLSETNEKQREARDYLIDELGIYKDINSLANAKLENVDKETQKRVESLAAVTDIKVEEGNIVKQLESKNKKLLEERDALEKNKKEQGANKEEIDKQIDAIDKKIALNDGVLEQILKEIGVWDDVKDSINQASKDIDEKNKKIDEGTDKQKKQGEQIDNNNKKTDEGIKKEEKRTKEAGKDVDKSVDASDHGTVDDINKRSTDPKDKKVTAKDYGSIAAINLKASRPRNKRVNLSAGPTLTTLNRQASSPVTKVVNFVGRGLKKLKFWAKGTPPSGHPGGGAVFGEEGRELTILPSGQAFLSPDTATMVDLPKGTHVIPNPKTERILKSMPKYAEGTRNWSDLFSFENVRNNEFMRLLALTSKDNETEIEFIGSQTNENDNTLKELLNATIQQNKILMKLLQKDNDFIIDGDSLAMKLEPNITNRQQRREYRTRRKPR